MNILMNLRNEKKFMISAVAGNVLVEYAVTPDHTPDCDNQLGDFIKEIPRLKWGEAQNSLLIDRSQAGNLGFRR